MHSFNFALNACNPASIKKEQITMAREYLQHAPSPLYSLING